MRSSSLLLAVPSGTSTLRLSGLRLESRLETERYTYRPSPRIAGGRAGPKRSTGQSSTRLRLTILDGRWSLIPSRAVAGKPLIPGGASPRDVLRWLMRNRQLGMALVGGALLLAAFLVHAFHGPNWLRMALIIPAYFLTGWFTFLDTAKVLWEIRFDIDVLMFAAAFGAAALGHYEEGGLLLFLFALGGAGEQMAMDRARRAIQLRFR